MPLREFSGAAPRTTLAGTLSGVATSFSVASGTGYPTGTNPFVVVVDRGLSTEEKILCSARSGANFTVATSGRGYDSTTAQAHADGAYVEHCIDATTLTELNLHANDADADNIAHAAAKISYAGGTGLSATNVEAAIDELAAEKLNTADLPAAIAAGMIVIDEEVMASDAASVTFSAIPGTYRHLRVVFQCATASAAFILLRFNGDSGTNYDSQMLECHGATVTASASTGNSFITTGFSNSATLGMSGTVDIPGYARTSFSHKHARALAGMAGEYWYDNHGIWKSSAAITSVTFAPNTGDFKAGTVFTLYGLATA